MVICNPVEIVVLTVTTFLFIVTVFINYWSSSDNGEDIGLKYPVGNVSDSYPLLVTPAGWTFAIWGVIYGWQALWLLYGWSFVFRPSHVKIIPLLAYVLFSVSCGINIGWIYAFTNKEVVVAFALLLLLSVTLYAVIGASVFVFYNRVRHLQRNEQRYDLILVTLLLHNGVALYATWTSIAALLNMGIIMKYTGNHRQDSTTVGLVVLSVLILEVVVWFLLENSILDRYMRYVFTIYPVLIWALSGIIAEHIDDDGLDKTNSTAVGALVLSGLLFIVRLVFAVVNLVCRRLEYPDIEYRRF